jgi:osmotically-inducible protein OsmY
MAGINHLRTETTNSPAEVAARLFRESPYHCMRRLNCQFSDGTLTIAGQVPNYYMKQLAHIAVRHLDGVSQISNLVEVVV